MHLSQKWNSAALIVDMGIVILKLNSILFFLKECSILFIFSLSYAAKKMASFFSNNTKFNI